MKARVETFVRRMRMAVMLCLAAGLGLCLSAQAETLHVDDSGTTTSAPITKMRWRQLIPGRAADHIAQGELQVDLRLNLTRWLHKPVRLYMRLAPTVETTVLASWQSQGRLLPGSVRSGDRTLVYEGLVPAAILEESLQMRLSADGRQLSNAQTLSFYFELEALP